MAKFTLSRPRKPLVFTAVLAVIGIGSWLVLFFPYEVTKTGEKRLKNFRARLRADSLARLPIRRVQFAFELEDEDSNRAISVETAGSEIAEIISAFKKASRSTALQVEPGGEAEIQDRIRFFLANGVEASGFSLHRGDLDAKWGPEVKAIWQKYRKIAVIEKPADAER